MVRLLPVVNVCLRVQQLPHICFTSLDTWPLNEAPTSVLSCPLTRTNGVLLCLSTCRRWCSRPHYCLETAKVLPFPLVCIVCHLCVSLLVSCNRLTWTLCYVVTVVLVARQFVEITRIRLEVGVDVALSCCELLYVSSFAVRH